MCRMPRMMQRLSQRAKVNWLPQLEVMTAGTPYLAIQPCVRTAAQDSAEMSETGRTSNHLVFLSMTVNTQDVPSETGSGPMRSTWICENCRSSTITCTCRSRTWQCTLPLCQCKHSRGHGGMTLVIAATRGLWSVHSWNCWPSTWGNKCPITFCCRIPPTWVSNMSVTKAAS
jgi:hypothetical protein